MAARHYPPLAERLWSRVEVRGPDECWPWTGHRAQSRGQLTYGRIRDGSRDLPTSRVVWLLTHGSIPAGMLVCHTCDNPPCCNPAHLFLGTHRDNSRDMVRKGRGVNVRPFARGEANPQARLTTQQVIAIREQVASGLPHRVIAARFGISRPTVGKIANGIRWSSL